MIGFASTLFSASVAVFSASAITLVIMVSATTKQRSAFIEEGINIIAKTAVVAIALAAGSLALVGFPIMFDYLTATPQ